MATTYCDFAPGHPVHGPYHDAEYGFPLADETKLFERLALEIFQAGLSWEIVLKKRPALVAAFDGFEVDRVARFDARRVQRLLKDPSIIRNRLKVAAVIANARHLRELRASHGGFEDWLGAHHPLGLADWVKVFRSTFTFTGGEICNEFLMSIGYLPGAHRPDCPVYRRIARLKPPWAAVAKRQK
jgi:DNA-3-methyladenine glycosylase I